MDGSDEEPDFKTPQRKRKRGSTENAGTATGEEQQHSERHNVGEQEWEDEMVAFLASVGAESAWPAMRAEQVDLLSLPLLGESDLLSLGVISSRTRLDIIREAKSLAQHRHHRCDWPGQPLSARQRLALTALCHAPSTLVPVQHQQERQQLENTDAGSSKHAINAFGTTCKQQSVRRYIPDLPGSKDLGRELKRGEGCYRPDPWHSVPSWHKVPGTDFLVDTFKAEYKKTQCEHWFLTHFHTDHWKGLRKTFKQGMIHCTPQTARLVKGRLGIEDSRIVEHQLYTRSTVGPQSVSVTSIDANHCPGACMFLFEVPGHPPLLHTGDFRFCEAMKEDSQLKRLRNTTAVVLDTTYASEQHCFPSQEDALQYARDAARAEASTCNPLFLVGTYSLGKENVVLAVAEALDSKIFAPSGKLTRLKALGFDMNWFTEKESEARVRVVGMWQLSHQKLARVLDAEKENFDCIVAFKPTGWTYAGKNEQWKEQQPQQACPSEAIPQNRSGKREQKGSIVIHNVPYSEHSSFDELVSFLHWFRPVSVIPSVAKSQKHSDFLAHKLLAKAQLR